MLISSSFIRENLLGLFIGCSVLLHSLQIFGYSIPINAIASAAGIAGAILMFVDDRTRAIVRARFFAPESIFYLCIFDNHCNFKFH